MPVPEERLYHYPRLNRWFAVSSLLMTGSIFWMVWVDYYRPWRVIQDNYYLSKAAFAHLEYLQAITQEKTQEIEEAKRRLADAQELVSKSAGHQRRELQARLEEVTLQFNRADGHWSRNNQVLDVTRDTFEKVLNRFGPDHPHTEAARRQYEEERDEVERLLKEKERWEDEKQHITKELRDLEEPIRVAEKKLRELEMVAEDANDRDMNYRGVLKKGLLADVPVVRAIINFPLLDFTAPKNTPSRHQVNQLVLQDVRQRLNYLESYTTDRCTTCHVAIGDAEFSQDRLAQKLERTLPAINEALQRVGEQPLDFPPPPPVGGAGGALPEGQVTDFWHQLTRDQQNAYFSALVEKVNHYLKLSGRKTIKLGQPLLAHPNLELFVSVNSAHPMATMGCTVCHEGNPQETDFVQAAHTPPTHEIEEKWKEEYYLTNLGVPRVTFETIEHFWERPMRLPRYTEAGCAKCHAEITDIARFDGERVGSRINLGSQLFTEVGCINCHVVNTLPNMRRVGPDLSHVASKLKPEFVQQWVFYPQKFRPSTRMPHFFLQENNIDDSATGLDSQPQLRTETEVAAITKYLFAISTSWEPIRKPEEVVGDVQRGRDLFKSAGCLGCHSNLVEFGEQWITRDLMEREGRDGESATYKYRGMTHEERVRYAMEHFTDERETFLQPEATRFDPGGAYAPPVFTRFAPELSGIGSKVGFDWLYSWLIDPKHYAPDTKMPGLRLTPGEATDIAVYLETLRNDSFDRFAFEMNPTRQEMLDHLVFTLLSAQRSERRSRTIMLDEGGELTEMLVSLMSPALGEEEVRSRLTALSVKDKKTLYLGNKSIAHYGCYTCHLIPGFENTTPVGTELSTWAEKPIAQLDFAFYDDAFHDLRKAKEETFAYVYPRPAAQLNERSPIDDLAKEQITHTHAAFAKHKMLNPRIWDREKIKKPYDKLKMPNFYFTEEEAEALTTFLLSRIPPRVNDVLKVDYDRDLLGPIAEGRQLTRELNCVACHQFEDNSPTIQQYFIRQIADQPAFDEFNAPPRLWGEGAKVQHNWLHSFVQHVETLRPWLQVRMPSFHLTGDQATTLAEYFAALSRYDANKLTEARAPVLEYMEQEKSRAGSTEESGADGAVSPTGSDWYQKEWLNDAVLALRRWAMERKLMRSTDLDPLGVSPERLRSAHADLFKRTGFLRELYDVEYPFVEPPAPLQSEERFTRGRMFFKAMGCLQCHVLGNMLPGPAQTTDDFVQMYRLDGVRGDGEAAIALINGQPYSVGSAIDGAFQLVSAANVYNATGDVQTTAVVEGSNAAGEKERVLLVAPSAPNLSLTFKRLRRAWVFDWMLEPQWIQPGTKMPQNFPGGTSPFAGDPHYPGTGLDHVNLLVDFLYHAGATSTRSELSKIVVSDKAEEFSEEAEEFED